MLNKLLGKLSKDVGVDLGTATTLIYVRGRGIIINEPSVVAVNQKTGQILAIGEEAKKMVGRTPAHISAIRPLREGIISDFEVTEQMLRYFINKVHKDTFTILPRPRVIVGIPSGITEVERKAVRDAALNAGAREVYLVEEAMSAAIGARLPVQEALGNMVIDIGGGTADIAVISLGGVVASRILKIAGDRLNQDIIDYARDELKLVLGEKTAEDIKIQIGSAFELDEVLEAPMRGRDVTTGLPREIIVNSDQIRKALARSNQAIVDAVKETIEATPPELVADIMNRGIILVGGGSLLRGMDKLITEETKMPTKVVDDPLTAVARGAGIILEDLDKLKEVLVPMDYGEVPK
jgi:rod shape-determining protein MreB